MVDQSDTQAPNKVSAHLGWSLIRLHGQASQPVTAVTKIITVGTPIDPTVNTLPLCCLLAIRQLSIGLPIHSLCSSELLQSLSFLSISFSPKIINGQIVRCTPPTEAAAAAVRSNICQKSFPFTTFMILS